MPLNALLPFSFSEEDLGKIGRQSPSNPRVAHAFKMLTVVWIRGWQTKERCVDGLAFRSTKVEVI